RTYGRVIVLGFVPVVIIIISTILYLFMAPYFSNGEYDYDPAYVYLFNGVGLVEGFMPRHVDHPGTTLQMIIGAICYATWVIRRLLSISSDAFTIDVLHDPELYLFGISVALATLNALAVLYLGIRITRYAKSILLGLIAQAGYLLLGPLLPRLIYVSPEALI